jgi:hypothetical protein
LEYLAAVAQERPEPERAARLLGAATGLRETLRHSLPPPERSANERRMQDFRAILGEEAFERACAAGRAIPWEQAIAYALEDPS